MIKRIAALLLCLALMLSLVPVAAADAGLPQTVATYFSNAKYKNYTIEDSIEIHNYCFVVLKNGKENILYAFRKTNGNYKFWMRNKTAVPQGANAIELFDYTGKVVDGCNAKMVNPTVGIQYYTENHEDVDKVLAYSLSNGAWILKAYINTKADVAVSFMNNTLTYHRYSNGAKQGVVEGTFQRDIRHTSVAAIPPSLKSAQSKLTTAPELPTDSELVAQEVKFTGGQKYEVYSGPGKDFLRGANNKAAVSTNDWIQVFGEEDGWILIQYAINKDKYRFGYIETKALPKNTEVKALDFNTCLAVTVADTEITDDPLYSKAALGTIAAEEDVLWLASIGEWAYIESDVDDIPVRGFVPVENLQIPEDSDGVEEE